jgi:DNA-binding transcriptional LysR family regulator
MDRITEMQVFSRVVESGSFAAAARVLSLTPSGVSKLIARLENRLGALLFKRTSREAVLTDEGQRYFDHVVSILSAVEAAEMDISNDGQPIRGPLKIFVTEGFATQQLAPLMGEYHQVCPEVRVEFHLARGPLRVLDSAMDLGFYPYHMEDSAMVSRRLVGTRWRVCASPAYIKEMGLPANPSELMSHRCLNFSGDVPCNHWRVWDEKAGAIVKIDVQGVAAASDASVLAAMARAGVGITRLLEHNISDDLDRGLLIELFPPPRGVLEEAVYAVYHSRKHLPPRARSFLDFLQAAFAERRVSWRKASADTREEVAGDSPDDLSDDKADLAASPGGRLRLALAE